MKGSKLATYCILILFLVQAIASVTMIIFMFYKTQRVGHDLQNVYYADYEVLFHYVEHHMDLGMLECAASTNMTYLNHKTSTFKHLGNHSDGFNSFAGNTPVEILGKNYKIGCTYFNASGTPVVLVTAFNYIKLSSIFHEMRSIIILLISSTIFVICVGTYMIMQLSKRWLLTEASLRASLIKQKEATQQAEKKSINKSMAFASASHDIRTSLAGITGLIEICRVDLNVDSDLGRNLDQMNACASKLLGILNSVLDISKVEAGKMQLEEEEFDMAQVLEESVDIFHVVALKKGIEVIWDPCDCSLLTSSTVIGDSRRFKQIIDNLLSNAVKFTSEGYVIVRAWARKPSKKEHKPCSNSKQQFSACQFLKCNGKKPNGNDFPGDPDSAHFNSKCVEFIFEVDDSGLGIPVEKQTSVFENYVQVKESSSEEVQGTGLGLGIVQSFVRLMGGDISIKNKEPGEKGTCFRFNIFLRSKETSLDADDQGATSSCSAMTSTAGGALDVTEKATIRAMTFRRILKFENTHSLVLAKGSQTRAILRSLMENLGINVWEVDHEDDILSTVESIKDHLSVSGKSDSTPCNNSRSHNSDKERGDRSPHETDNTILQNTTKETAYPRSSSKGSLAYFLFIIDMTCEKFSETHKTLMKFASSMPDARCRFVWLATSGAPDTHLRRFKQRPDLVVQKPCHGSRLYAILNLLKELEETSEENVSAKDHPMEMSNNAVENKSSNIPKNEDQETKPLTGVKILLVDDDSILRFINTKKLSLLGATIEIAVNGLEALHLIKQALSQLDAAQGDSNGFPYDVILMDCEMNVMNGYEATRQIREEEKQYNLRIPIIALTAHAEAEEEEKTRLAGMDAHLVKPLNSHELLEAIRNACGQK